MTTIAQKAERATEILEAKGYKWTPEIGDAVRDRAERAALLGSDPKNTAREIARFVARQIKTAAAR